MFSEEEIQEAGQPEKSCSIGNIKKRLGGPENSTKRAALGTCVTATTCGSVVTAGLWKLATPFSMALMYGSSAFFSGCCVASVCCCLACKYSSGCNNLGSDTNTNEKTPIYPHLMQK